jgi:hypothetical protein
VNELALRLRLGPLATSLSCLVEYGFEVVAIRMMCWDTRLAAGWLSVGPLPNFLSGYILGLWIGLSSTYGLTSLVLEVVIFLYGVLRLNAILGLGFLGLALSRPQVHLQAHHRDDRRGLLPAVQRDQVNNALSDCNKNEVQ